MSGLFRRCTAAILCVCLLMTILSGMFVVTKNAFTKDDEAVLCEHHPKHTETCGYMKAPESHPCEFVCEICGSAVANWTWEDPYEKLLPSSDYGIDDVDWVLSVPERSDDIMEVFLPSAITATMKNSTQMVLPVSWDISNPQEYKLSLKESSTASGEELPQLALYTAVLPEEYVLDESAPALSVLVQSTETAPLEDEPVATASVDGEQHFIVRHWHSAEATGNFQGSESTGSGDRYFVVAEGYIVPVGNGYEFYLVYQSGEKKGQREKITAASSEYVKAIDEVNGTITLGATPVMNKNNTPVERFSTFSVSAGHGAVTYSGDNIVIHYDPYVHLVKAHAFYTRETMDVNGTADTTVFGSTGVTSNPEQDTVWVYTYVSDSTDSNGVSHKAGEIARNADGKPYKKGDSLPSDIQNIQLTKLYDTTEGMHTDKTASVVEDSDGRAFNLDLEAWYAEGYAPQVGMVLDASGSMAFTSDTPSMIKLSDAQIGSLGINKLPDVTGKSGNPEGGWNQYFLTDEQIDQILDKTNTDNSQLSVSGYNYFVYDPDSGTKEYAPLGYWEGVPASEPSTNYAFTENTEADVTTGWPNAHDDLHMDGTNGIHIGGSADNIAPSSTGILLDATPTNGNFTISFTLKKTTGDPAQNERKIAELMYIGSMSGTNDSGGYYRLFRDQGGSSNRLRGNQETGRGNLLTDINSVFPDNATHTVTLVFENGTVTSYLDGSIGVSGNNNSNNRVSFSFKNEKDIHIIFNGIEDSYNGAPIYIDDIYVFDAALTSSDVKNLASGKLNTDSKNLIGMYKFEKGSQNHPDDSTGRDWLKNSAGTTDAYASKLTRKENVTGNAEVVVPTVARTADGRILGSINTNSSDGTKAVELKHVDAGWYYITHSGNWGTNYVNNALLTGKRLVGIPGSKIKSTFTDSITLPNGTTGIGTGYEYQPPAEDTPIRFYVDNDGCLRCFCSRSDANEKNLFCSYVYRLGDSEYVKTESLQRALGAFVTKLSEISPAAEVSAVRFSTANIPDNELDKLVLLDWTNNAGESAGIMSLKRGNGGTLDSAPSPNGVAQYNYGLTGSTSTWRGLQTFINNLQTYDYTHDQDISNDSGAKYLIIFTDGLDTDTGEGKADNGKAQDLAEKLKGDGYTIFTVMLNGGPVEEDGDQYNTAHDFLLSLSGNSTTTSVEQREQYFFSVSKARQTLKERSEDTLGMNDADILTKIFSEEILKEITKPLDGYTITDYIDPRFDLVDADGIVWHLNSKGTVVKGEDEGVDKISVGSTGQITIHLSDISDKDAQDPYLCYDEAKDMYYLEWVGQTIPSSSIGAKRLAVWNAQVTVRAKNDFIGGNAVLTNGNSSKMNWVYHPDDTDASSGTGDRKREYEANTNVALDEYPSKGFPRTVVNVKPTHEDLICGQTIYMGETLSEKNVIRKLFDTAWKEGEDSELAKYYWEYLVRYAKYTNQDFDEMIEEIVIEKKLELPYYYIPNADGTNQTGTKIHEGDLIGYLVYEVAEADLQTDIPSALLEQLKPFAESYPGDSVTKDRLSRVTKLTAAFEPLSVTGTTDGTSEPTNRTETSVALLASDDDYDWDPEYKPADDKVGDVQEETILVDGIYYTKIVSGEVQLQLNLSAKIAAALQGYTITYTAGLMREYGDTKVKVGTLEIKIEDVNSEAELYTATFTPDDAYAYMGYDALSDIEYGLSIGTYTLVNGEGTVKKGDTEVTKYKFSQAVVVPNSETDSPYAEDGLFTKGSDYDDPELENKFVAIMDTMKNQDVLGDITEAASSDRDYTDYRFGLFRVELEEVGVAKTDDDSHPGIWIIFMCGSFAGVVISLITKKKKI